MALPQYDVSALIENIKRRCSVPTSQLTYTDEDFAVLANDEMQGEVVPLIMSAREEYFVKYVDVAIPADGVIPFPENTVGGKVRSVCYLQQANPLVLNNIPRIDLDVVAGVGTQPMRSGFYIQGNDIVLYPNVSFSGTGQIRIYYYKRTLVLAAPEQYGQIVSIDTGTNTLQLSSLPAGWSVGTKLNAVSSTPGFDVTSSEMTVVTLSSPSVVVDSIDGLSVGDYVSEQGYSAVPQIPLEAHAFLAQITAAKCLEGLGDAAGMAEALKKAGASKTSLMIMISQRVDGSPKKIVQPDGGIRRWTGIGRGLRGRR